MSDLFGTPDGKRTEIVQWGQRALDDRGFWPKGAVRISQSEEHAKQYGGAFYAGGPVRVEAVTRTVVTFSGNWERA